MAKYKAPITGRPRLPATPKVKPSTRPTAPSVRDSHERSTVGRGKIKVKPKDTSVVKIKNPTVPSTTPGANQKPGSTPGGGPAGKGPTVKTPPVKVKKPPVSTKSPKKPSVSTKSPKVGGSKVNIGFNPEKMAATLAGLGYDADIAEVQRQIDRNRSDMSSALADLEAWANQVEMQRAAGAAENVAAYDQALAENQANQANVAGLFGGSVAGESAAYGGVGQDILGAMKASGTTFDERLGQTLSAQNLDYQRRARADFQNQLDELLGQKRGLVKEKGQARAQNLLDLMQMGWDREEQLFQREVAQQALDQARQLAGYEVAGAELDLAKGAQDLRRGEQQIQAEKLAFRTAQVELQKLQSQVGQGGFDFNDPRTRPAIIQSVFAGLLTPKGAFNMNPQRAWAVAQQALASIGLANNPQAVQAIWDGLKRILIISHGRGIWRKWYVTKDGSLAFDPTRGKKK